MDNLDDLFESSARHDQSHPDGWTPGLTFDGSVGTITSPPGTTEPDWDDLIAGYLPPGWNRHGYEIDPDSVRFTAWDGWGRDEQGDQATSRTQYSFRAKVRAKRDAPDVRELVQLVRRHKPKATKVIDDTTLVVCWADWQVGKDDGDGTRGTARRLAEMVGKVEDRIKTLKPSTLVVAGLGDLGEACSGHYCVTADTPVLTHDLRWVAVGDLAVGDKLYAIQENGDVRQNGVRKPGVKPRRYAPSVVEAHQIVEAPVVRVELENGESITCTPEHPLLARRRRANSVSRYEWIEASELTAEHELPKLMDVWEPEESWEAGWLAGMFDGEGYLSGNAGRHSAKSTAGVSQKPGAVLDRLRSALTDRKFDYLDRVNKASGVYGLRIRGGYHEVLRLLGSIRPIRLIGKLDYPQANPKEMVKVVRVVDAGTQPIAMMSTSTRTYITAGYPSHNSQQTYRVELNEREQRVVIRNAITQALRAWAPKVAGLKVLPVGGNHGEVRSGGASFTDFADNRDVAVFEDVALIFAENPDAFGHVTFHIPSAELTQTIEVSGTRIGLLHGHQAKRGSSPEQRIENWWKGQMMGNHPIGQAQVLVSAHFHHLIVKEISAGRHWLQSPALDGGSDWFTSVAGVRNSPGTLTFTVADGRWENLAVL